MGLIGYFKNPNSYTSDECLKRDLNEIKKISEKNLSFLSDDEISRLTFLHERSALSLRRYLEEKEDRKNCFFELDEENVNQDNTKIFLKNLPVLTEKNNEIIHIHTAYTFDKNMKEGFTIANYINAELKKKEAEGFSFLVKDKVVFVVARVGKKQRAKLYCDNDNFETRRIVNTVFEHLGMSDNIFNMSFMSDFIFSTNEDIFGTHFFIVPYTFGNFTGEALLKLFDIQT